MVKLHKKVCLRWKFMEIPLYFHYRIITTSDIIYVNLFFSKLGRDIKKEVSENV